MIQAALSRGCLLQKIYFITSPMVTVKVPSGFFVFISPINAVFRTPRIITTEDTETENRYLPFREWNIIYKIHPYNVNLFRPDPWMWPLMIKNPVDFCLLPIPACMHIKLHCNVRTGVAHDFTERLYIASALQAGGCERMPQSVGMNAGNLGML